MQATSLVFANGFRVLPGLPNGNDRKQVDWFDCLLLPSPGQSVNIPVASALSGKSKWLSWAAHWRRALVSQPIAGGALLPCVVVLCHCELWGKGM